MPSAPKTLMSTSYDAHEPRTSYVLDMARVQVESADGRIRFVARRRLA